jgi:serine/threonine protein kinase
MDPRWNRGGAEAGDAAASKPAASPGPTAPEKKNPSSPRSERTASPTGSDRGGYSIVFSPSWVTITTPIGEGAFSRVYEGVYTNPETHEKSIVAVKVLKLNMLKRRADCLRFIKEAKTMTKVRGVSTASSAPPRSHVVA